MINERVSAILHCSKISVLLCGSPESCHLHFFRGYLPTAFAISSYHSFKVNLTELAENSKQFSIALYSILSLLSDGTQQTEASHDSQI